jgi:hypothetical protein
LNFIMEDSLWRRCHALSLSAQTLRHTNLRYRGLHIKIWLLTRPGIL